MNITSAQYQPKFMGEDTNIIKATRILTAKSPRERVTHGTPVP